MAKSPPKKEKTKEQQDKDASSDPQEKEVTRNNKGEITSWDSTSKDGKLLKTMFDNGIITTETATEIKDEYDQYAKYATKTLGSAVQNLRRQMKKQTEARKSSGSKSKFSAWTVSVDTYCNQSHRVLLSISQW